MHPNVFSLLRGDVEVDERCVKNTLTAFRSDVMTSGNPIPSFMKIWARLKRKPAHLGRPETPPSGARARPRRDDDELSECIDGIVAALDSTVADVAGSSDVLPPTADNHPHIRLHPGSSVA